MSAIGIELRGKCADTLVDPHEVEGQLVELRDMDPELRHDLSLELARQCLDCTVESPGAPDIVPADQLRSDQEVSECPVSARRAALLAIEEPVELVPLQSIDV